MYLYTHCRINIHLTFGKKCGIIRLTVREREREKMRKNNFMVLDTETVGELNAPLVYDFGYRVTNRKEENIEQGSFVISDIFDDEKQMIYTCSYNVLKAQLYENMLLHNEIDKIQFLALYVKVNDIIKKHNIKKVYAYNMFFDKKALNTTIRFITKNAIRYFFPENVELCCIYHMACQVLLTKKSYITMAIKNGWYSAKNNVSTNAENTYRYLINNKDFFEKHTALADVEIECKILNACFKQKKKLDHSINSRCWQIPQKNFLKIQAKIA